MRGLKDNFVAVVDDYHELSAICDHLKIAGALFEYVEVGYGETGFGVGYHGIFWSVFTSKPNELINRLTEELNNRQ
jgi:hypothetical protein